MIYLDVGQIKKQLYILVGLGIVLGFGFGAADIYRYITMGVSHTSVNWEETWDVMEDDCIDQGFIGTSCYQEVLPRLIKNRGPDVVDELIEFCNTFGSRPHNGCYHALGFGFAELSNLDVEDSLRMCDENLSENDRVHCYNSAIAHILKQQGAGGANAVLDECRGVLADDFCMMAVGSAFTLLNRHDLNSALVNCTEGIAERHKFDKKNVEYCWAGVFIENYHSGPIVESDPWFPCNTLALEHEKLCVYLQPRIMSQQHGLTISRIERECKNAPGELTTICADGLRFLTVVHEGTHSQGQNHKCSIRELVRTGDSSIDSWVDEYNLEQHL